MDPINCQNILALLQKFSSMPVVQSLLTEMKTLSRQELIPFYHKAIPILEQHIWGNNEIDSDIAVFQGLFREFEQMLEPEKDLQHDLIIIIPVADRPRQLENCLQSIISICDAFGYGGKSTHYNKVSVLIAEDSQCEDTRFANKALADSFTRQGLLVTYFGIEEQQTLVKKMSILSEMPLDSIIKTKDYNNYYHKGASTTRNITYLKLNELIQNKDRTLCYFIDSDQEFKINIMVKGKEKSLTAINYFYYLNKIFTDKKIQILTGKVVGDPPVSPSVMVANYLADVDAFLNRLTKSYLSSHCQFHSDNDHHYTDDAAYHDMAGLLGFEQQKSTYDYTCELKGEHSNEDCFIEYSKKINRFFDGEHLTRRTCYQYMDVYESIRPARTVYTGNYILSSKALRYFIPFANLKFRMAGPTLGRFIKNEIAEKFISANLPMLHGRIAEEQQTSEFRPGIEHNEDGVSLSVEYERQFYGDVMLFSVEEILSSNSQFELNDIQSIVIKTEASLREQYKEKLDLVNTLVTRLKRQVARLSEHSTKKEFRQAIDRVSLFIKNIENNFTENSYAKSLVCSNHYDKNKINAIVMAISQYQSVSTNWKKLLKL